MIIRATTAPGLEDIAIAEGGELLLEAGFSVVADAPRVFDLPGVVSWDLGESVSYARLREEDPLRRARSLFHVAAHVAEIAWDGRSLESLLAGIRDVDLDELTPATSFRVSCSRTGEHDFHSPEVERETGSILYERCGSPVDLEGYDLHVKVDVVANRAFCGYQLTRRKGLDRRYRWVYHPRVTLRTPIAYGMLRLAGYAARLGALYDPFCGSGTILMEAAGVARDRGETLPPLAGSDRDPVAVEGARANMEEHGLADSVAVCELDARALAEALPPHTLDYIVTNPPFGIRLARGTDFEPLYTGFLEAAVYALAQGGTLALLVGKRRGVFQRVLHRFPEFQIRHVRVIEMGGVYATLFVLGRIAEPTPSYIDDSENQD